MDIVDFCLDIKLYWEIGVIYFMFVAKPPSEQTNDCIKWKRVRELSAWIFQTMMNYLNEMDKIGIQEFKKNE